MGQKTPFRSLLEEVKASSKVLILASYKVKDYYKRINTNICLEKLERLKSFLIEKGFHQTMTVKDWMDEEGIPPSSYDVHFLKKKSFLHQELGGNSFVCFFHRRRR